MRHSFPVTGLVPIGSARLTLGAHGFCDEKAVFNIEKTITVADTLNARSMAGVEQRLSDVVFVTQIRDRSLGYGFENRWRR